MVGEGYARAKSGRGSDPAATVFLPRIYDFVNNSVLTVALH